MNKQWRDVIIVAVSFIYGTWLYSVYSQEGPASLLENWWKGLIPSLLFLAVVFIWYRRTKKQTTRDFQRRIPAEPH